MKEIIADEKLVAKCGLYCGACGAYLKGRCPGCAAYAAEMAAAKSHAVKRK